MYLTIFGSIGILILSFILTRGFQRSAAHFDLNSESFRDSTKLGITLSTFAYPLIVTGSDYFQNWEFWCVISTVSLSTFFGLWNSFSLATLTTSTGIIPIRRNQNNLIPTFLVAQFSYLIFAIALVLLFQKKPVKKIEQNQFNTIQYRNLNAFTKEDIIRYWGIPDKKIWIKDTCIYTYKGKNITEFKFLNDTLFETNERTTTTPITRKK